jgi:hypothetical protein
MNYTFVGLLIAVGLLLLEPGLAPAAIRFNLVLLSTLCLISQLAAKHWTLP